MKLCAGTADDIRWDSGLWIILDIGFAAKSKSCGLSIGYGEPICMTFGSVKRAIAECVASSNRSVNLLIEAPLSVCFDPMGNPKGRSIEKDGQTTRYWYVGPGAATMIAAMYLLNELRKKESQSTVRLFEGLISFKSKDARSNHIRDIQQLRNVVQNPRKYANRVVPPEKLKCHPDDVLISAFSVVGLTELGIPTVIKCTAT